MEWAAETIVKGCALEMHNLDLGRQGREVVRLRRLVRRPVGIECSSSPALEVRVLGLRHGKQRIRRLRRTFEELVDRIAEHLRYLVFDQCAARARIAKQRQHGRAPRRIRSRRVVELGEDLRILRVERRAKTMNDEEPVVDPL